MELIPNFGNPNDTSLKRYVVTLKNMEDSESFYEDMETEGGNLYIPHRAVECANRRPISRSTHYMLTYAEAAEVRKDPRVLVVELNREDRGIVAVSHGFTQQSANFSKVAGSNSNHVNWGLKRSMHKSNQIMWGMSGNQSIVDDIVSSLSGKNVDVVVSDGGTPNPTLLEYAQNPDGTGYSRMVEHDWGQYLTELSSDGVNPITGVTYSHAEIRDMGHSAHTTGTTAGNSQGWARDANIYNISYTVGINYLTMGGYASISAIDMVRMFHKNKPINPLTGVKNPTVMNNSWGYSYSFRYPNANFYPSLVSSLVVRGVEHKWENVRDHVFIANYIARLYPFVANYSPEEIDGNAVGTGLEARDAETDQDYIDAMREGIIIVASAGNGSSYADVPGGPDYDNYMVYADTIIYINRGGSPGAAWGDNENERVICVGSMGHHSQDYRETGVVPFFSSINGVYSATEKLADIDNQTGKSTRITTSALGATSTSIPLDIPDEPVYKRNMTVAADGGITLPWNINYLGQDYNQVCVLPFGVVLFGVASLTGFSSNFNWTATNPSLPKLFVGASFYFFHHGESYYEITGTAPNRQCRARVETFDFNYPVGCFEVVFYEANPTQIDVHMGYNANTRVTYNNDQQSITGAYQIRSINYWMQVLGDIKLANIDVRPNTGTRITTQSTSPEGYDPRWYAEGSSTTIVSNLLGKASLTESTTPTVGVLDDGRWTLNLPFSVSYCGYDYNTVHVDTNSYLYFEDPAPMAPVKDFYVRGEPWNVEYNPDAYYVGGPGWGRPRILITTSNNYCFKICYGVEGSAPNRTYRIRYEGSADRAVDYNNTNAPVVWEVTFYEATPAQIDIQIGANSRWFKGGVFN